MRKNLNRKDGQFRRQNFRSGQSNFSNKLSLAIKVAATSQLLLLTTAATPPSQDKSNFGLETNDLRSSFPDDFSTIFGQQKFITTNVGENVSSPTIEKLETQTSPIVVKPLPSPAEHTNSEQNSPSSIGPPGFLPPNDEIIKELNDAQNFLDLAESLHLKRMFKNNNTD
uniref:Uncharacterized protein n=1 Tax=Onchocerca volvulus TaxID=6282 RepID=A0A8R1XR82_ONCVO